MAPKGEYDQTLPSKEGNLFKQVLRLYETKQYKKGLKNCDLILKKFPDNGETVAMKGLIMNCIEKKEEAKELIRRGLRLNLTSHVCWHVYGLYCRSDRNYTEAIKAYSNALRFDKDNGQILRDLSVLQIQMRDLKGNIETRRQLLVQKPSNRMNWVGFSMAYYLRRNYKMAIQILDQYMATLESDREKSYDESEMLMYKNKILEASGDLVATLNHLDTHKNDILDVVSFREKRGEVLLRLGKFEDAKVAYREMLSINPENYSYHRGIQMCILETSEYLSLSACELPIQFMQPSKEQLEELNSLYTELTTEAPRCWAHNRIPLELSTSDAEFRSRLDAFLRRYLNKGVPSLFSSFKSIYQTAFNNQENRSYVSVGRLPASHIEVRFSSNKVMQQHVKESLGRVDIVGSMLQEYLTSLKSSNTLPQDDQEQPPTVILWVLYFYSQHLMVLGKYEQALEHIDEAIEHTPTLVDLFQCKARILKYMGDHVTAAEVVDRGRRMDLADRYINSKATKYLLRGDNVKYADKVVTLFTKHEGHSQNNLFEMQCMWFEIEAGHCHYRLNNIAKSAKYFTSVFKHFEDIEEDQFDFHSYCLRKMTLRAYLDLLRMEDTLRNHKFFVLAAIGALNCFINIFNHPNLSNHLKQADEVDFSKMTAAERKKAKQLARKKAKKLEQQKAKESEQTASKVEAESNDASNASGKPKRRRKEIPVDPDPEGNKLYEDISKAPLEEAAKVVCILRKTSSHLLETHMYDFDVSIRRGKYLQALKATKQMIQLMAGDINHPVLFCRIIPFYQTMKSKTICFDKWILDQSKLGENKLQIKDMIYTIIMDDLDTILKKQDPSQLAKKYFESATTFDQIVSSSETLLRLGSDKDLSLKALSAMANTINLPAYTNIDPHISVHHLLKAYKAEDSLVQKHFDDCRNRFVRSTFFHPREYIDYKPLED